MKFRKKPIIVEAYQWNKNMGESAGIISNPKGNPMLIGSYYVKTISGYVSIQEGDWIIKGISGEYYPCKPDIFEKIYEAINE